MMAYLLQLDGNILLWIQEYLRNPWLTALFTFTTRLGNGGAVWIVITLLLLCFRKTRRIGVMSALALLCSLLINNLFLKPLVARTRPYELVPGLMLLGPPARDFSFPSGHSGSSMASGWVLFREWRSPWRYAALILTFAIAFSRLYIGIHYPSDVLVGLVTGFISAEAGRALARRLEDLWSRKRKEDKNESL